jgi:hypothetical protein
VPRVWCILLSSLCLVLCVHDTTSSADCSKVAQNAEKCQPGLLRTDETVNQSGRKGSRVSGVHCNIRLPPQPATVPQSLATLDCSAEDVALMRVLPLLEDTSTNGTWINFAKLKKNVPTALRSGDLVKLVNPAPTAQDPEGKCPGASSCRWLMWL